MPVYLFFRIFVIPKNSEKYPCTYFRSESTDFHTFEFVISCSFVPPPHTWLLLACVRYATARNFVFTGFRRFGGGGRTSTSSPQKDTRIFLQYLLCCSSVVNGTRYELTHRWRFAAGPVNCTAVRMYVVTILRSFFRGRSDRGGGRLYGTSLRGRREAGSGEKENSRRGYI